MRRNASQVLAIFLILCSAVALLQVSIALGSSRQLGDSPRTTQTIRSYYASANSVIAGDELQDQNLLSLGDSAGMDPGDAILMVGALRATYPNLRLLPGDVSGAGDLALSQVTAVNGDATLPAWINDGVGSIFPDSVDSLQIENGRVIERQTSARIGVMAQPLAGEGVDFRLNKPSHLTVSDLVLSEGDIENAFVGISGPGFVIPRAGSIAVEGNGVVQVANSRDGTSRIIEPGEMTVITNRDILIVPSGRVVLRPAERTRPHLLVLSMLPTQPDFDREEGNKGLARVETLEDVMRRLSATDGAEQLWFGTVHVLATAEQAMQPGWLTMDMTRIVVPAEASVRLSPRSYQSLTLVRTDDAWSEFDAMGAINASGSTWMLESVRACWRGTGPVPQQACVGQATQSA